MVRHDNHPSAADRPRPSAVVARWWWVALLATAAALAAVRVGVVRTQRGASRVDHAATVSARRDPAAARPGQQPADEAGALVAEGRRRLQQGDAAGAARCWQDALQRAPDHLDAANELALLLATSDKPHLRDEARAVELAERVCEATHYRQPPFIETLAAAYAEARRLGDAAFVLRRAIAEIGTSLPANQRELWQDRLHSYEATLRQQLRSDQWMTPGTAAAEEIGQPEGEFGPNVQRLQPQIRGIWWHLVARTAWLYATNPDPRLRDGPAAVRLAQRAVRATESRDPACLTALAAALAEVGDTTQAAAVCEAAWKLATAAGQHSQAERTRMQQQLEQHRRGLPWREEVAAPPEPRDDESRSAARRRAFVHYLLALWLQQVGQPAAATAALEDAVAMDGELRAARLALARAYLDAGHDDRATFHFSEALRDRQNDPNTLLELAGTMYRRGWVKPALMCWLASLRAGPAWSGWSEAANNAAWLMATHDDETIRNPSEALRLAELACSTGGQPRPDFLATLAAAQAANGQYAQAAETTDRALAACARLEQFEYAEELRARRGYYGIGQPAPIAPPRTLAAEHFDPLPHPSPQHASDEQRLDALWAGVESLRLGPERFEVLRQLAWVLATYPDPHLADPLVALQIATRLCEETDYSQPLYLDALAAAFAALGRFREAESLIQRAVQIEHRRGQGWLLVPLEKHRLWYQAELPPQNDLLISIPPQSEPQGDAQRWKMARQHLLLAAILAELGFQESFFKTCLTGLEYDPRCRAIHLELGRAYLRRGMPEPAARHFQSALYDDPQDPDTLANLGSAWLALGAADQAIVCWNEALRQRPQWPSLANNLAWLLLSGGPAPRSNLQRARQLAHEACRLSPDDPLLLDTLAAAHAALGDFSQAVRFAEQALQHSEPDGPAGAARRRRLIEYRNHRPWTPGTATPAGDPPQREEPGELAQRGLELFRQGQAGQAVECWNRALALQPDWPELANNLAWLLATHPDPALRDGSRAVRLARAACEKTGFEELSFVGTLAAAYAERNQFDDALRTARHALRMAQAAGDGQAVPTWQQRIEQLQAGQPLRVKDRMPTELGVANAVKPVDAKLLAVEAARSFRTGRAAAGLEHLRRAVELSGGEPQIVAKLAWILAVHPDPAVRDPRAALELLDRTAPPDDQAEVQWLDIRAAAQAASGQFEEACRTAEAALQRAAQRKDPSLTHGLRLRLERYRQDRPYYLVLPMTAAGGP